jgi:Ca2+-binding RTX toxin-like protein
MAAIYIEGKPVGPGVGISGHLYLVYKTDSGNEYALLAGPSSTVPPHGALVVEGAPFPVLLDASSDNRGDSSPSDRGSTLLDLGGRSAESVWEIISGYAEAIASAAIPYSPYSVGGYNSNSFVASVLSVIGININDVVPNISWTAIDFVGMNDLISTDFAFHSTPAPDRVFFKGGNDSVIGVSAGDFFDGGAGSDTISVKDTVGKFTIDLQANNIENKAGGASSWVAVTKNFENYVGNGAIDTVFGTIGANKISTGGGNDEIHGRGGNDDIDGGEGFDKVWFDYGTSDQFIFVNLETGFVGGILAGTTLLNVEGLIGGASSDTFFAGTTGSYLDGGAGDDFLFGGAETDEQIGGLGHDTIYGSLGADKISDVDDVVINYSGSTAGVTISGEYSRYGGIGGFAQGDTITLASMVKNEWILTEFADKITVRETGKTIIYAGGGNDDIWLLGGNSVVNTGAGYDTVRVSYLKQLDITFGESGKIFFDGAPRFMLDYSNDGVAIGSFYGNSTASIRVAGSFDLVGSPDNDIINGNDYANVIIGGAGIFNVGIDTINGFGGDDVITARGTINGGEGNDTITGSGTVHGDAGDDIIFINSSYPGNYGTAYDYNFGNIFGDAGDDTISGGGYGIIGNIYGGSGGDTITTTSGSKAIVYGESDNDFIRVSGDAIAFGGDGNDTIIQTGLGAGTISGGSGADILNGIRISYQDATSGIAINGNIGIAGDALGDSIVWNTTNATAHLWGSNFGDVFQNISAGTLYLGTGNNEVLNRIGGTTYGNTGNDHIIGDASGNVIYAGGGNDTIRGGGSGDVIYLSNLGSAKLEYAFGDGADKIYGFKQGVDAFYFDELPGAISPEISLITNSNQTLVNLRWYDSLPVEGEALPHHVDASITLMGASLSSFIEGRDYFLV